MAKREEESIGESDESNLEGPEFKLVKISRSTFVISSKARNPMRSIVSSETRDPDDFARSFAPLRMTCYRKSDFSPRPALSRAEGVEMTERELEMNRELEMTERALEMTK
jgi:hypothetical protein